MSVFNPALPSESSMRDFLLAYDASCGHCGRFKRALALFDIFQRIDFVSLAEADKEGKLANLPESVRFRSFHVILPCGEIRSGADVLPGLVGFFLREGLLHG